MILSRPAALFAALLTLASVAVAQRLPTSVTPEHYTLALEPDLATATFTGSESIDVKLAAPSNTITLNAAEITFKSVTAGGQTATVTEDKDKEQATFTFPKALPAGPARLEIAYTGILNGQLRGFYLSKSDKRSYAVTQFEPTDARRAFPAFDEPAYKATFDVSLTVDQADTAISNTNIISDTPAKGGKHTLRFATTPKMSTYLVAFLVGDFVCTSGESDGVPIRACATPDKLAMTPYAVKAATFVLHYYDTYFGIKYPMPKLDMIAIPDFEAGAMENFGAITYRETDFLIDEKTASDMQKQRVAEVVAHEMAHQWFGDMVTMQWWNNLWLNEGFATWMETKPVAAWHPEWNVPEQVAAQMNGTLDLDAARVTRTIRAEANTPDQINEMFDGITYQKGGAVLGMVENYLGEEVFRQGVHNYLQAHLFANATAEDFWNAQTANSHKPVDKLMSSFIAQPGEPLLTFSAPAGADSQVAQQRFFLSPSMKAPEAQSWDVPVCIKGASCDLLASASGQVPTGSGGFFYANAGGKGYYRSSYPPEVYAKLLANVETGLTPEERISLVGDEWAQVRAEKQPIGASLDLAAAVKQDPSANVLNAATKPIASAIGRIADDRAEKDKLAAWVRATYEPVLEAQGMPAAGDTPAKRQLRNSLFQLVGIYGKSPKVIAEAKQITQIYLDNPAAVDPGLGSIAEAIAAQNGDAALFDELQKKFETPGNPQLQETSLQLLTAFRQPALVVRALDYAASGKVRNQDSIFVFASLLNNPDTHDVAWNYIQQNWSKVQAQITTMMGGYLVGAAGSFCSAQRSVEVEHFFAGHKVPASERALAQAKNQISDCIELRAAQGPNLEKWLAGQNISAQEMAASR
jgi:aminopeptidase N